MVSPFLAGGIMGLTASIGNEINENEARFDEAVKMYRERALDAFETYKTNLSTQKKVLSEAKELAKEKDVDVDFALQALKHSKGDRAKAASFIEDNIVVAKTPVQPRREPESPIAPVATAPAKPQGLQIFDAIMGNFNQSDVESQVAREMGTTPQELRTAIGTKDSLTPFPEQDNIVQVIPKPTASGGVLGTAAALNAYKEQNKQFIDPSSPTFKPEVANQVNAIEQVLTEYMERQANSSNNDLLQLLGMANNRVAETKKPVLQTPTQPQETTPTPQATSRFVVSRVPTNRNGVDGTLVVYSDSTEEFIPK